jgi:hypothetical protein
MNKKDIKNLLIFVVGLMVVSSRIPFIAYLGFGIVGLSAFRVIGQSYAEFIKRQIRNK